MRQTWCHLPKMQSPVRYQENVLTTTFHFSRQPFTIEHNRCDSIQAISNWSCVSSSCWYCFMVCYISFKIIMGKQIPSVLLLALLKYQYLFLLKVYVKKYWSHIMFEFHFYYYSHYTFASCITLYLKLLILVEFSVICMQLSDYWNRISFFSFVL